MLKLKVVKKIKESSNVTSFYMEDVNGNTLPEFKAGQFLTFKLDSIPQHGKTIFRSYTLSDCYQKSHYRLSIKKEPAPKSAPNLPKGLVSNYFHDYVEVGTILSAQEPAGDFYFNSDAGKKVALLSGGIGITPLLSMMNQLEKTSDTREVYFVHGAKNSQEHPFKDHIKNISANFKNLKHHFLYSQPFKTDKIGQDYHAQGRVDIKALKSLGIDIDFEFYLCGPNTFLEDMKVNLSSWGVPDTRINYEYFSNAPKGEGSQSELSNDIFKVSFTKSDKIIEFTNQYSSILDMALQNDLEPDFGCQAGMCQACAVMLDKGQVEQSDRIMEANEEVLICSSIPVSDVSFDI